MEEETARELFGLSRVARLATITPQGEPHLVPVVFALSGAWLWTVVDAKPKRTPKVQRLANIAAHPRVSLLVDHYDEDWASLWWVRADGAARVLPPDGDTSARRALAAKYPQYRETPPPGPVVEVVIDRWRSWAAVAASRHPEERL